MDIYQVQTKNIHALNDVDLNYLLLNRAQFLRSYFRSFKEVILNFPTNTELQRTYWLRKKQQATNTSRLKYIEQKLFEFEFWRGSVITGSSLCSCMQAIRKN